MSLLDDSQEESVGIAPSWRGFVDRQQQADDPEVRASFFLGLQQPNKLPLFLPRSLLADGHMHVRGMTGSGKTSATLLPVALQVLRGYNDERGQPASPSPLVIIDLKGDAALFHAIWEAACQAGRKFRYFSVQSGDDYHFFDPLQIFQDGHLEPIQLATTFVRAPSVSTMD